MKSILLTAATLLASGSAEHQVVVKDNQYHKGAVNGDLVIHSFSKPHEARAYVGDHLTNTKVEKWGVERIFGEERKSILVIPESQNVVPIRYKVTVGPKTGKIYWQNTDFTGHGNGLMTNDWSEKYMDVPYQGRSHARTGGELLFNWIFGLVDDDESGTIDEGEVKEDVFKKMDANNDQKVDATDFDLLKAEDVFSLLDEDNSGTISASELPVDLIENIEKSDDSDANNDKQITLEEFEAMYTLKLKWEEKLKKSGSGEEL